jgi:hypothetical protein
MQRDGAALERRVLTDLAVALARHPQQYLGRIESTSQLLARSIFVAVRRLGLDRVGDAPPFSGVRRALFQRKRRRVRRARGLEP